VAPPADAAPRFTRAQLVDLVGPVALYPDPVLASLLPATAFPLDVVAAARWLRENGADATPSPEQLEAWDPSVAGLVQFPDVLLWLDENLPWLEQMGVAVANQQGEVMEAIQEYRRKAREAGNLRSDEHQSVVVQTVPEQPQVQVIVIEPASPSIVYIPYYDPYAVIYPVWGAPYYGFRWSLGFTFGSWGPWCHYGLTWGWYDGHRHHYYGGIRHHHRPHYWFRRNLDSGASVSFSPRSSLRTGTSRVATTWSRDGQVTRVRSATRPEWSTGTRTTIRARDGVAPVARSETFRPRTPVTTTAPRVDPSTPWPSSSWTRRGDAGQAAATRQGTRWQSPFRRDGAADATTTPQANPGTAAPTNRFPPQWRGQNGSPFPRFRSDTTFRADGNAAQPAVPQAPGVVPQAPRVRETPQAPRFVTPQQPSIPRQWQGANPFGRQVGRSF
jgi:hypothetical protein